MRFHSTFESSLHRGMTYLAIVETILATSAAMLVAVIYHTLLHIAFGAGIALLLLLRTPRSTALTHKLLTFFSSAYPDCRCHATSYPQPPAKPKRRLLRAIWLIILLLPLFCLLGIFVLIAKVLATVLSFLRHPVESICAIPANWFRVVFTMDCMHPPEVIPEIEGVAADSILSPLKWTYFAQETRTFLRRNVYGKWLVLAILTPTVVLFVYAPALLYRLALKSTAVIFLPFVWIVGGGPRPESHMRFWHLTLLNHNANDTNGDGRASF